jgi:hypothetical protein
MDINAALQKVTGRAPDDAQIQRIKAIAHELEIPPGDTMLAVLAIMDVYYGSVSAIPASMATEADKAAKLAASGAQQEINSAVAGLLTNVTNEIAASADKALVSAARSRRSYSLAVLTAIMTIFTSIVLTVGFFAGEIADAKITKGGWYWPAWVNRTGVEGLVNAPAFIVILLVFAFVTFIMGMDDIEPQDAYRSVSFMHRTTFTTWFCWAMSALAIGVAVWAGGMMA